MPDLPTLTVTQAQADRLMLLFGSVQAYKDWLKQTIIHEQQFREKNAVTDLLS